MPEESNCKSYYGIYNYFDDPYFYCTLHLKYLENPVQKYPAKMKTKSISEIRWKLLPKSPFFIKNRESAVID